MNTLMYEHPLTEQHLCTVREVIGYTVVGPIGKKLACGDVGASPFAFRRGCDSHAPALTASFAVFGQVSAQ